LDRSTYCKVLQQRRRLLPDDEGPHLKRLDLPKIYAITDRQLSGLSHATQVEHLIAGGAGIIQLRDKYSSAGEFYRLALEAVTVAKAHGIPLIINDRVDIAMIVGADGVHLGQDDMPVEAARRLLGEKAIIGISTHRLEQAAAAAKLPVDYIAFGPVFSTTTKADPDEVVGLSGVAAAKEIVGNIPLVAIGGINASNVREILAAGADAAAMISEIVADAASIDRRMRRLNEMVAG
jgi:thiamine-phosphate pyrophosphorylase